MYKVKSKITFTAYKILSVRTICQTSEYEITLEGFPVPVLIYPNHLSRALPKVGNYVITRDSKEYLIVDYILSETAFKNEFEII